MPARHAALARLINHCWTPGAARRFSYMPLPGRLVNKAPVIATTTVVGTAIFATLQQDAALGWRVATGLLSVIAAVLAALQTFFNYGGEAQRHFEAAVGFARLWRHMDQFKLRHASDTAVLEECLVEFAVLVKELDDLEQLAPRISNRVWQQVKNQP